MPVFNAINNATARASGSFILGFGSGNVTYDASTCVHNTFIGQLIAPTMTANAASNVGAGYACLGSITSAARCTALGASSLISLLTGQYDIALGYGAGSNYSGAESSNLVIGNPGVNGESHVLRIGQSGNSDQQQNEAYIAGITTQVITDASSYDFVMIDPATDKLVAITPANGGSKITDYSTPGSFTWTKDARTKTIQIYGWTGGGGGGSGSKSNLTDVLGGNGGPPGSVFYAQAPAMFFGATEPVVVGSGGAGGAPQTINDTNGNNGSTSGTSSSFGNLNPLINATGGGGGSVGLSIQGPWIYINQQLWSTGGDAATDAGHPASGYGQHDVGSDAENSGIGLAFGMCPTGGGGGAGRDTITPIIGGKGGKILTMNGLGTLVVGGASGNRSAGGNGINGLTSTAGGVVTGGTGGGGGSPNSQGTFNGFPGGVGGFPGGGGGGGSGGLNSLCDSGAGAQGGGGRIIVVEIF